MKKFFFFAAAAVVAIASCTNVDLIETPATKVSFQVASYAAQTRAAEDPTIALQDETTFFYSKAWMHANGGSASNFFGTSATVGGNAWTETVNYTAGTPVVWEPTLEYFWPKSSDSYINFVSWFGTNSKFPTVTETTMDWGTSAAPLTIATDDNFLFADEAWRYKDNVNPATYTSVSGVSEGVPTIFHHALAKLAFNVRLSTDQTATRTIWDVAIQTVTLKVGNNGYLALVNEDKNTTGTQPWKVGTTYSTGAAATSANIGWARPASPTLETIVETGSTASSVTKEITAQSFTNFAPTAFDTDYDGDSTDDHKVSGDFQTLLPIRTVMPQIVNGGVVTFGMTFQISTFHGNAGTKQGDAYSVETVTIPETNLYTLVNTIANWNMNTKYTYNITIDPVGKTVKFDPVVCEWAEVDNGANGTEVYTANN